MMVTRNQVIHAMFNELQAHLEVIKEQDIATRLDALHHEYADNMMYKRMSVNDADSALVNHDLEALVNG